MNKIKILRWTTRIVGTLILLFAIPFYFGYGNPLPFTNPENSLLDNIWLIVFPIVFIGLGLGWKTEKIAGYIISIPIIIGNILTIILLREFGGPMLIPLVVGLIYIYLSYKHPLK